VEDAEHRGQHQRPDGNRGDEPGDERRVRRGLGQQHPDVGEQVERRQRRLVGEAGPGGQCADRGQPRHHSGDRDEGPDVRHSSS
jgi:hypothetical protein